MTRVVGVVPAAGRGARFGGGKLVAMVKGRPMIERAVRSLLDGGVESVVVVLAERSEVSPSRVPLLADPRVRCVVNQAPERGMFSSIQTGLAAALAAEVVVVIPGDMPFIEPETTRRVAQATATLDRVAVAIHQGRRGHPVAVPARLRHAILDASSESNLSELLKVLDPGQVEVEVNDPGVVRDIDRIGDL